MVVLDILVRVMMLAGLVYSVKVVVNDIKDGTLKEFWDDLMDRGEV